MNLNQIKLGIKKYYFEWIYMVDDIYYYSVILFITQISLSNPIFFIYVLLHWW